MQRRHPQGSPPPFLDEISIWCRAAAAIFRQSVTFLGPFLPISVPASAAAPCCWQPYALPLSLPPQYVGMISSCCRAAAAIFRQCVTFLGPFLPISVPASAAAPCCWQPYALPLSLPPQYVGMISSCCRAAAAIIRQCVTFLGPFLPIPVPASAAAPCCWQPYALPLSLPPQYVGMISSCCRAAAAIFRQCVTFLGPFLPIPVPASAAAPCCWQPYALPLSLPPQYVGMISSCCRAAAAIIRQCVTFLGPFLPIPVPASAAAPCCWQPYALPLSLPPQYVGMISSCCRAAAAIIRQFVTFLGPFLPISVPASAAAPCCWQPYALPLSLPPQYVGMISSCCRVAAAIFRQCVTFLGPFLPISVPASAAAPCCWQPYALPLSLPPQYVGMISSCCRAAAAIFRQSVTFLGPFLPISVPASAAAPCCWQPYALPLSLPPQYVGMISSCCRAAAAIFRQCVTFLGPFLPIPVPASAAAPCCWQPYALPLSLPPQYVGMISSCCRAAAAIIRQCVTFLGPFLPIPVPASAAAPCCWQPYALPLSLPPQYVGMISSCCRAAAAIFRQCVTFLGPFLPIPVPASAAAPCCWQPYALPLSLPPQYVGMISSCCRAAAAIIRQCVTFLGPFLPIPVPASAAAPCCWQPYALPLSLPPQYVGMISSCCRAAAAIIRQFVTFLGPFLPISVPASAAAPCCWQPYALPLSLPPQYVGMISSCCRVAAAIFRQCVTFLGPFLPISVPASAAAPCCWQPYALPLSLPPQYVGMISSCCRAAAAIFRQCVTLLGPFLPISVPASAAAPCCWQPYALPLSLPPQYVGMISSCCRAAAAIIRQCVTFLGPFLPISVTASAAAPCCWQPYALPLSLPPQYVGMISSCCRAAAAIIRQFVTFLGPFLPISVPASAAAPCCWQPYALPLSLPPQYVGMISSCCRVAAAIFRQCVTFLGPFLPIFAVPAGCLLPSLSLPYVSR